MTGGRDGRGGEGHAGDRPTMTDAYAEGQGGAGRALEEMEEGRDAVRPGASRTGGDGPGRPFTRTGEEGDA